MASLSGDGDAGSRADSSDAVDSSEAAADAVRGSAEPTAPPPARVAAAAAAVSPDAPSAHTRDDDAQQDGTDDDADTIATRTRTKFSLVDVPIDTLESCLPDIAEPIIGGTEYDHEYQRFLSSLLPHEQENLSFLDEEDDEYEPPEDDDDEEEEEEDGADGDGADAAASAAAPVRTTTKISKTELKELLWDSTQLGVAPLSVAAPTTGVPGLSTLSDSVPAILTAAASVPSSRTTSSRASVSASGGLRGGVASIEVLASLYAALPPRPPAKPAYPPPTWFRRVKDGAPSAPVQELHGTITQEQCLQLASQMHKHVQLLLQSYHLCASSAAAVNSGHASSGTTSKKASSSASASATPAHAADETIAQRRAALAECRAMLHELQTRGKQAQACKTALLAKLSQSQQDHASSTSRRVTRSLTAAHAAVTHPSMFELVGLQDLETLTQTFEAQCSVSDRTAAIAAAMREVDKHVVPLPKAKKRQRKAFTLSEDNLLAHGAKRFALETDPWASIATHFLPNKTPVIIQRRYRYLTSNKTGASAVKAYHAQFPRRRDSSWILEEDLRIARGMVAFHDDVCKRYARTAAAYLPHRSRVELRKRWARIQRKFYSVVEAMSPGIDDASMDFAVLVKDLLEDKLREQVKQQSLELIEGESGGDSDADARALERRRPMALPSLPSAPRDRGDAPLTTEVCAGKDLHPALFFTSWALIRPETLLQRTCEHNWPAFVDHMAEQQQQLVAAQAREAMARMAVSSAADPKAAMDLTMAALNFSAAEALQVPLDDDGDDDDDEEEEKQDESDDGGDRSRALSTDVSSLSVGTLTQEPLGPAAALGASPPPPDLLAPNAPTAVALDDDDEDDDSDYEHDELVSSDGDAASDSDDFEQLELSDDDDDDEDDESFDYEELANSDDDGDGDANSSSRSASDAPVTTPPRPIRYTLRLAQLKAPMDAHATRVLAALERRLVGRSACDSVAVQPPAARPSRKKRIVALTSSSSASSAGVATAPPAVVQVRASAAAPEPLAAVDDNGDEDGDVLDATALLDFDLATDEVLEPSSSDDSYEHDVLPSDSESETDTGTAVLDSADAVAPTPAPAARGDTAASWRPSKRRKVASVEAPALSHHYP